MSPSALPIPDAVAEAPLFPPGLRVAVVAASLDILGGHGVEAALLASALRQEGCDVAWVPVNPRFPAALAWVRRVPYARTLLNQALYLRSLGTLRRRDVIHVFAASYWSFLLGPVPALLAGRAFGRRVVLHYHSGEAEDHLANWGLLVHPFLRTADALVVPSGYLRRAFAVHGYATRVVRNVVDLGAFRYRKRPRLRPRLLSVRNLERHYGVDVILEAFTLLRAGYPEATLTVAGTGREEARLRRLADRLGAGGIRFVGRVERDAIARLYAEADVFVNASVVDNQPVSILEAFAAGLPVVSTATGGIPEMVRHEETGLLVPPGDAGALARAVVDLIGQPDRAARMARRARWAAEAYSWPAVRRAWARVYAGGEP